MTVIGPNGGGKSTLLKVALGLIEPCQGFVEKDKSTIIGYMPQKINFSPLMPMTVERFLSLSTHSKNLSHILDLTAGKTLIHKQIHLLSGGELQKVLLARCLMREPNLLVLDEPTQGVDAKGQASMYHRLLDIKRELSCAILMVTHDLRVVFAKSDQVLCLNKHICCFGAPDTILDSKEYKDLGFYHHHHDHEH